MTEEQALLAGVLATPDDDLPRLVLADWLDENGQSARAEFIRLQCEISRRAMGDACYATCEPPDFRGCAWVDLRQRERRLFDRYWWDWCPDGAKFDGWDDPLVWRRGFVSAVRTTLAGWMGERCPMCRNRPKACMGNACSTGIGPAVLAAHPVETLELVDAVYIAPTGSGQITRDRLGVLYAAAFPTASGGPIECRGGEYLRGVVNRAALEWARAEAARLAPAPCAECEGTGHNAAYRAGRPTSKRACPSCRGSGLAPAPA